MAGVSDNLAAMIEGGGLGVVAPEDVGPIDVQWSNGVVDLRVADDAAAVDVAKRYLGYFGQTGAGAPAPPGEPESHQAADQTLLRDLIPANRKRAYDVRRVIENETVKGNNLTTRMNITGINQPVQITLPPSSQVTGA